MNCTALLITTLLVSAAYAKAVRPAVTKPCVAVVKACHKGGFVPGSHNKHPGQGLWASCVRPLSRGHAVPGVTGVSKNAALVCLKSRQMTRAGKS
jgi:hypothetical protein